LGKIHGFLRKELGFVVMGLNPPCPEGRQEAKVEALAYLETMAKQLQLVEGIMP
jgi:hypothetical protein